MTPQQQQHHIAGAARLAYLRDISTEAAWELYWTLGAHTRRSLARTAKRLIREEHTGDPR